MKGGFDVTVKTKQTLQKVAEEAERALIEKTLKAHDYNINRAAPELGVTRQLLYRRLKKYGIKRRA